MSSTSSSQEEVSHTQLLYRTEALEQARVWWTTAAKEYVAS